MSARQWGVGVSNPETSPEMQETTTGLELHSARTGRRVPAPARYPRYGRVKARNNGPGPQESGRYSSRYFFQLAALARDGCGPVVLGYYEALGPADSDSAVSSESRAADPGAKHMQNSPRQGYMVRQACTISIPYRGLYTAVVVCCAVTCTVHALV